jgi:hypothetical protein
MLESCIDQRSVGAVARNSRRHYMGYIYESLSANGERNVAYETCLYLWFLLMLQDGNGCLYSTARAGKDDVYAR